MNRKIIFDRFSHEHTDFRFGEARDDVVSRPLANESTNHLGRHFTSTASHEQCHFKNHVAIATCPLVETRSYGNQELERDKLAANKSYPLLAHLGMLIDHTRNSREPEADSVRSSLTYNSVDGEFALQDAREDL
jgi:hypothetical protein